MPADADNGDDTTQALLLWASRHARIVGRYLYRYDIRNQIGDMSIRFDWPGVRLTFRGIRATRSIGIRMNGGRSCFGYRITVETNTSTTTTGQEQQERHENNEEQHEDGHGGDDGDEELFLNCFCWFTSTRNYTLTDNLDASKRYKLEIWKRDDPMGIVEVFGLLVDKGGSASEIPIPPETGDADDDGTSKSEDKKADGSRRRRRVIEFVGDSDTVGFGNRMPKSGMAYSLSVEVPLLVCGFLHRCTDVNQSWCAHVAKSLNADYHVIAQSGITSRTMATKYRNVIMGDDESSTTPDDGGASNNHPPLLPHVDAVAVYIGNNDQDELASSCELSDSRLLKDFKNLLRVIREARGPEVKIIVVVPALDAVQACRTTAAANRKGAEMQNRVWREAVLEMGGEKDNNNFYVVENRHEPQIELNSSRDFGMMLHWNAESCRKWANGAVGRISEILDWPIIAIPTSRRPTG